jgi:hypothetical protein
MLSVVGAFAKEAIPPLAEETGSGHLAPLLYYDEKVVRSTS